MVTFEKQPAEVQDYDISFVNWLAALSDTGLSIVVTADSGITLVSSSLISGIVKVWLSGGINNTTYKITITLTTANTPARVKQYEFQVKVKDV